MAYSELYVASGYWATSYTYGEEYYQLSSELQSANPSAIIELFELQLNTTQHGVNDLYRFHAGTNNVGNGDIVWAGNTYTKLPIEADGFAYEGTGQLPRPKIRCSNILGTITALLLTLPDGLEGAQLTRIRTMARYLDAVNFPDRRNLFIYTEDFSQWTFSNATTLTNQILAPDGTLTADKFYSENAASASHQISKSVTLTSTAVITFSCYIKKAERDIIRLQFASTGAFSATTYVAFNLVNGTIVSTSENNSVSGAIIDAGDGWFRCSITATPTAAASATCRIALTTTGTDQTYAETVGYGPYIWGAQFEIASSASAYQPITGSTFSRNPYADSTAEWPREIYFIDRKSAETRDAIEFELASAFDLAGVYCPKRLCLSSICPWKYRGAECGYTGTNYYDTNDTQVFNASQDVCGKRLSSCEARFGEKNELPFGGFPGAGQFYS